MSTCKNCGAELADGAKFCAHCGTPVTESSIEASEQSYGATSNQVPPVNNATNTQTPPTYNTGNYQNYNQQASSQYNTNAYPNNPYGNNNPYYNQQYQKNNGLCIAGFIVSLVGIIPILSGIVGIILSVIGLNKIKVTNERGKGFGIAGIIIGSLNILAWIGYFIIVVYFFQNYGYYYY